MHLSQRCNFEHAQDPMVEAGKRASIAVDLRVSDPLKLLINYFLGEDDFSLDPEPRGASLMCPLASQCSQRALVLISQDPTVKS